MQVNKRSGFILVVVVSLLGTMAGLAVSLSMSSRVQSQLARNVIDKTRSLIAARSGVEHASIRLRNHLVTDLTVPVTPSMFSVAGQTDVITSYAATASDVGGSIDLNDGIVAGRLENIASPLPGHIDLGGAAVVPPGVYRSWAIDPWPEDPDNPGRHLEDVSALINLRVRRLLNCWADAYLFTTRLGWPEHAATAFTGSTPFGSAFTFTSTCQGPKHQSLASVDFSGSILTDRFEILAGARGLGDRLLAGRPGEGYREMTRPLEIAVGWAAEAGVQDIEAFREVFLRDTSVHSDIDATLSRIVREPGPDRDGDGRADFDSDVRNSRVQLAAMDLEPFDMTDLWRPHAASIINLSAASELVRAAVFYAPTNVSFLCQGLILDGSNANVSPHGVRDIISGTPTLGVGGAVYREEDLKENGFPPDPVLSPSPDQVQRHRFMSLRDALALARTYSDWSDANGAPWSFNRFTQFLVDARGMMPRPERNTTIGSHADANSMRHWTGNHFFDDNAWWLTLPHVLSAERRLPGFLGAPVALLSPYIQENPNNFGPLPDDVCQRRIEDFVSRMQHPKVGFMTSGSYRINSTGKVGADGNDSVSEIRTVAAIGRRWRWRSQSDLTKRLAGSTTPEIRIGPEPTGVAPSKFLGVIGLNDRHESIDVPGALKVSYRFDGSLEPESGSDWSVQDPASDPMISPPNAAGVQDVPPISPYPTFGGLTGILDVPFDVSWLSALRNDPRPNGRTWWVPDDGDSVLMGLFGLTPAQCSVFFGSMPGFPLNGTGDEICWWWCDLNSLDFKTFWPGHWKDGVSPLVIPPNNWTMVDSSLEGPDHSMFSADGCDLSPFGGVLFSSRNHGPRAADPFTDSFYFRPSTLLKSLGHSTPGELFDKMTISFWYRLPSGYLHRDAQRTYMQLDLWERMEMQRESDFSFASPMQPPSQTLTTENRPVSAKIWMHSTAIHSTFGAGTAPWLTGLTHPGYGNDMALTSIPFPSGGSLSPSAYKSVMTPLPNGHQFSSTLDPMYWFTRPTTDYSTRNKEYFRDTGLTNYGRQPGGWHRITVEWNLDQIAGFRQRYYDNVSRHAYAGNGSRVINWAPCGFNEHMILGFGETPGRFWKAPGGHLNNWSTGFPALIEGGYYPLNRCDTLIDNITILLGEASGISTEAYDPFAAGLDAHPTFNTKRYDISVSNEPRAAISLSGTMGRLLAVGARIHDVPLHTKEPMTRFEFARVDLAVGTGGSVAATTPRIGRVHQGQLISSSEMALVDDPVVADRSTLELKWCHEGPNGQALGPSVYDIPWVTSVSCFTLLEEGSFHDWRQ